MMTKVLITALTSFSHGMLDLRAGECTEIHSGEAKELEHAGLIRMGGTEPKPTNEGAQSGVSSTQEGAAGQEPQPGDVVIEQEDHDDVLGEKMAPAPENKMAADGANKSNRKK